MHLPAIGQTVLWHPYADRTKEPLVGTVKSIGRSTLQLHVIEHAGTQNTMLRGRTIPNVRHIDDPDLIANRDWKINHGGWDWIRVVTPPRPDEMPDPVKAAQPSPGQLARERGKTKYIKETKGEPVNAGAAE